MDIFRQPGLSLEPEIAQVGGELGEWRESPIHPSRFEISPDGVDLDVRFTDAAGRPVQVRIDDRNGRPRHRGTLLAPVGVVIEDPAALSLFVIGGCDLVRPEPPGQVLSRPHGGRLQPDPRRPGGHRELAPALHVAHLRPRQAIEGTWQLGIDGDPAVVGGFWTAERRQDIVELVLDVVQGWRPTGLPPLMAAVTRLAPRVPHLVRDGAAGQGLLGGVVWRAR